MSMVDVDLADVADLTADGVLQAYGVDSLRPSRRQWPDTQEVGEAYWRSGCTGLIAPSAARQDGKVLAVFRARRGRVTGLTPRRPARRYSELPALPVGLRT